MDRDLDWGRWRRQPETAQFLQDLQEQFPEVARWFLAKPERIQLLQGQAQVIDYIIKELKHDGR